MFKGKIATHSDTGSPPLTRFFGPEKNRVKGTNSDTKIKTHLLLGKMKMKF